MHEDEEASESRQMVWLIGAGLALVVAIVISMVALWPDGEDAPTEPAARPAATPRPAGSSGPESVPGSGTSASASRSSKEAGRSSPSRTPSKASRSSRSPAATATTTPPALNGPPASDRTGAIAGGDGCLDVAGGSILLNNAPAVRRCDQSSSQRWTLAADGTLRSSGLCLRAEGGDVVLLRDCGEGGRTQWRTGPGGTLVNPDADGCLTRGENDRVRLASCGRNGQDWRIP